MAGSYAHVSIVGSSLQGPPLNSVSESGFTLRMPSYSVGRPGRARVEITLQAIAGLAS